MNNAGKTYTRQFATAMILYVAVLIFSITVLNTSIGAAWRIPLAIAPVIPVLYALRAYLRYLNRLDELQQRIQLTAIGFAAGATGILTFTYGFLENAGFPRLSFIWVLPILIFLWGAASFYISRRYS